MTKKDLKNYVAKEDRYVADSGTRSKKRRVSGVAVSNVPSSEPTAQYPLMEERLATWIRDFRSIGVPVETYMVDHEARTIFGKLYLDKVHRDGSVNFKFSSTWRTNFFKRHNFSVKNVSTRGAGGRTNTLTGDMIEQYHMDMRVAQMSGTRDAKYGYCSPCETWNHDQVPIALAPPNSRTAEDVGEDVVWDSVTKSSDCKRFCTLNLTVPMICTQDNYVKPHVIFQGTRQHGDDWHDASEREEWGNCHVTFNEKAWANGEETIRGLECLKADLMAAGKGAVDNPAMYSEDNLGSHKTNIVDEWWEKNMAAWIPGHKFVPPNTTWCTQAIDHHIGIQYKLHVYKKIRAAVMTKMNKVMTHQRSKSVEAGASNSADGTMEADVVIVALTAREKRIIITQAIEEKHKQLWAKGTAFESAFVTTGTCVDISHLLREDGPENGVDDEKVAMQGLETYSYVTRVTKTTVLAARERQKVIDDAALAKQQTKMALQAVQEKAAKLVKEARDAELAKTNGPVLALWSRVKEAVARDASAVLKVIAIKVGPKFVVAGSFLPSIIAKHLSQHVEFEKLEIKYNDIDVYVGEFGDGSEAMNRTKHDHELVGGFDVNVIIATGISSAGLTASADINAVAMSALYSVGDPLVWNFSAEFFDFLTTRMLRPLATKTPAITLIRLLWKAEQLGLKFLSGGLQLCPPDVASAQAYIFYDSQKEKNELLATADAYADKYEAYFRHATATASAGKKKVFLYVKSQCSCGSRNRRDCVQDM
jgi:hypothetical protein